MTPLRIIGGGSMGDQLRIDVPAQSYGDQLRVPCPTCGAQRGEPCRTTTSGDVAAATHRARRRQAAFKPVKS